MVTSKHMITCISTSPSQHLSSFLIPELVKIPLSVHTQTSDDFYFDHFVTAPDKWPDTESVKIPLACHNKRSDDLYSDQIVTASGPLHLSQSTFHLLVTPEHFMTCMLPAFPAPNKLSDTQVCQDSACWSQSNIWWLVFWPACHRSCPAPWHLSHSRFQLLVTAKHLMPCILTSLA